MHTDISDADITERRESLSVRQKAREIIQSVIESPALAENIKTLLQRRAQQAAVKNTRLEKKQTKTSNQVRGDSSYARFQRNPCTAIVCPNQFSHMSM